MLSDRGGWKVDELVGDKNIVYMRDDSSLETAHTAHGGRGGQRVK
jgi:hypothetical protein